MKLIFFFLKKSNNKFMNKMKVKLHNVKIKYQ